MYANDVVLVEEWFDRKLICNVQLEKMAKKADEWIGRVTRMSRGNGQVKVDRERMVWELPETMYRVWQQKCGEQEDIVHAGSWSQYRWKWVGECWRGGGAIQ